MLEYAKMGR